MRPSDQEGPSLLPGPSPGPRERREGRDAILVVAGPTGTGKSALALEVARRIGGEIVGCDALQVYCGFDAATAKPSAAERSAVRHWLIDVADPRRDYSVADYVRDADDAISRIVAAGRVPIVVGGTGMYLRALLKGLVPAPARDEALRARLRSMLGRFGPPRLHRLLTRLDPVSAERIPPPDAQRVVRALELALSRGETWSARLTRSGTWEHPEERYRALKLGIDMERKALAARLADRAAAFFDAGLPAEVEGLIASGVPETANAFKGIGYREVLRARESGSDPRNAREAIVVATRQYAKRQRTWFRKEPGIVWLDAGLGIAALAERVVSAWSRFVARGGGEAAC